MSATNALPSSVLAIFYRWDLHEQNGPVQQTKLLCNLRRPQMMRQEEYTRQAVRAIETEIRTGHTFARIALDADDPTKTSRNAANAWKAYKTAKAWLEKADLNVAEHRNIADKLKQLKAELAKLPPPK